MSEKLFTVKDLAFMFAPSGEPGAYAKIMRQIRHWTNCDVLKPLGSKDTGTGVSRVYDLHGARKAAILVELSRYGVTVEMLAGFDEWCDEVQHSEDWKLALESGGPIFIGVTWPQGHNSPGVWRVISEDAFFAFLAGDPEVANDPTLFEFASLLLVNISTVFERVPS